MITGVLTDTPPRRRSLDLLRRNAADPAMLDEATRLGYRLALISCVPEGWEELPPNQAVLLRYGPEGWHPLAMWPYPQHGRDQRWKAILSSGAALRPIVTPRSLPVGASTVEIVADCVNLKG